ncbi:hypothetical protein [Desulfoscipio geothermicus]|uniref:Uncharacterized protein n=1 Tax=Desulfoscipio geothermicus DSM 3669 TaxID=1121426 RepID=A0A1I6EGL0_9FIRM|nr:hypothetical protein [Desulfoscipio geothermicus]SFR16845.1 hypothetical protein SAMN05660706_14218 [Desulfoscipio geothermicus DSM 3669]
MNLEEMHALLARVRHLAEVGLAVEDQRHCRQLLSEICLSCSEYVVK